MTKFELTADLASLTNIPKNTLDRLTAISIDTITQMISDTATEGDATLEVDIGIGSLFISTVSEAIKFKFIPAPLLEQNIKRASSGKFNPITAALEASLSKKIHAAYKEIL